ncbi:MAG: pilus assembly protein CpaF [Thermoleophilaceae bacterium]|nr:pilus assembly protein CpaF [Thermoleophilaceae bacterium]
MDPFEELAEALRRRLIERARDGGGDGGPLAVEVRRLVDAEAAALPEDERDALAARVVRLATGLGPIEPLLADPAVDEVMVNGPGEVWVERRGKLARTGVVFGSEAELGHTIERILAPLGRRVDEASPLCDARLPDGSRVNVVIAPLALSGPCLTIRKFRTRGFSLDDLVAGGTLPRGLAQFLAGAVAARAAVLVSGGTGSGKTTTLGALSGAIPDGERIVTIEDAAELRLRQRHVVRLESRPANVEGRGEVTIRQLVRNALRMRPDRIVVGEVRGAEALDMLMALNTGHEGSLTTVHANSPEDALRRVETLALMAGVGLPHAAVREQVASALDLVVHQSRGPDGSRRVQSVAEVVRVPGGAGTRELYRLRAGRPFWRPPSEGGLAGRVGAVAGGAEL